MIIIYDTSAAGNVKNWKAPANDTFNWPRLIHLAWQVYDDDRNLASFGNKIIRPQGFDIPPEFSQRSGVQYDQAMDEGEDLKTVLKAFNEELKKVKYAVSFNLNFNRGVLLSEYIRSNMDSYLEDVESFCLMRESTYFCKIPSRTGGYKWPSLAELYAKLFKVRLKGLHQADTDVIATASSFYRLVDMGQLEDLFDDD